MGDKNPNIPTEGGNRRIGRQVPGVARATGAKADWSSLRREQEGGNGGSKYTQFLPGGWPWQCSSIRCVTMGGVASYRE